MGKGVHMGWGGCVVFEAPNTGGGGGGGMGKGLL